MIIKRDWRSTDVTPEVRRKQIEYRFKQDRLKPRLCYRTAAQTLSLSCNIMKQKIPFNEITFFFFLSFTSLCSSTQNVVQSEKNRGATECPNYLHRGGTVSDLYWSRHRDVQDKLALLLRSCHVVHLYIQSMHMYNERIDKSSKGPHPLTMEQPWSCLVMFMDPQWISFEYSFTVQLWCVSHRLQRKTSGS